MHGIGAEMPLPEFADEKEFRTKWIRPFLSKMGLILPKHVHGPDEQGKDFYFADFDRFGHLRFYAAPVKLGDIGTGAELTGLLDQIERCFEVTLKYHKGAHDQRISGVYVIVSGRISTQARERIWERCRQNKYGENVFFLDGETLDNLDRHALISEDRALRTVLRSLLDESINNIGRIYAAQQNAKSGRPLYERCRKLALDDAVKMPLLHNLVDNNLLFQLWDALEWHNNMVSPYGGSIPAAALPGLVYRAEQTHALNEQLREACRNAMRTLDERYELSVEISGQPLAPSAPSSA